MKYSSAWPGRSISVVSIAAPEVGLIRTIAVPDALMCIARRVPSGDHAAQQVIENRCRQPSSGRRTPLPSRRMMCT